MKGWYGDKQAHSLASRGIKSKQERIKIGKINEKKFEDFMKLFLKKENITLREDDEGYWYFTDEYDAVLKINMDIDSNGNINQGEINAFPTGTGIGKKVMDIFKLYADTFDKYINLNEVENLGFVSRVGGFERVKIDKESDEFVFQKYWEELDDLDDLEFFVYNRGDEY